MHTLPYENCALNLEFMEMKTKEAYLSSNMVFCFSVLFAWLSYRYMRYTENKYLESIILYQCLLSKIHSDYDIFDEDSFDVANPVELISDYVKNNSDDSSGSDNNNSSSSESDSDSDSDSESGSESGSESDSDSDDNKPLNLLRRSNRRMVLRSDTKKSKIKTQYDYNGIEHSAEHGIDYAFDRDYRYTNARVFGDRDGDSDGDSDNDMDMDTTKSLGIKGTNWKLE